MIIHTPETSIPSDIGEVSLFQQAWISPRELLGKNKTKQKRFLGSTPRGSDPHGPWTTPGEPSLPVDPEQGARRGRILYAAAATPGIRRH